MRVERILDDNRLEFSPMTRSRWLAMTICAMPVIYLVALARPARIQAQESPAPPLASQTAQQTSPPAQDLQTAQAEVARLEQLISRFKADHMGRLPEQFQLNVTQMNSYQVALGNANEAMARLQQEKLLLSTQLQNLQAQQRYYESSTDTDRQKQLEVRIQDMKSQLSHASEIYTPENPSIKRMQAQLEAWQNQLESERSRNPRNEKMLLDIDGSINMLKAQMQNLNLSMDEKLKQAQELNRVIAQYQQRIEASPALEEQYAKLMRDYELAHQRLMELAARRPQGKVELRISIGPDGVPRDIRVIRSQGAGLDAQALEWAKSMRFRPAERDGQPVPASVVIEFPLPQ